jgi:hypothetical protein
MANISILRDAASERSRKRKKDANATDHPSPLVQAELTSRRSSDSGGVLRGREGPARQRAPRESRCVHSGGRGRRGSRGRRHVVGLGTVTDTVAKGGRLAA